MAQTYEEIIQDFDSHLAESKKRRYSNFYIGVAKDARDRLKKHNIGIQGQWYIFRIADSNETAKEVEKHYLELGMKGGVGDGDEESKAVYCYQIGSITIE